MSASRRVSLFRSAIMKRSLPVSDEQMFRSTRRVTVRTISTRTTIVSTTTRKKRKVEVTSETTTVNTEVGGSSTVSKASADALEALEKDTLHESWYKALAPEFSKPYFQELKKFIISEHKQYTIYPPYQDVYSWSRLTPLDTVKAVVIGQDPYHDVGQAHGLAFSVLPPTKIPPSLRNIYKQIKTDVPSFTIPTSGDLRPLAKQGVLWLNTCLTVRAHQANSHSGKGWETFTSSVLRAVTSRENGRGVVVFAWGIPAQKTCEKVAIDEERHLVLKSAHPSPLSAHRGFLGNGHFNKANDWLRKQYGDGEEIDWTVLNK
ncbi:uracil-DNA glycosylase [Neolentinus lepideus HHB14362 ss-1]|uniref:Uracil-DNA glycosylase n=1 Tax=Neolentinus lepideus HHB14362 ss-1 TaxID=1314782 RepID=A0A165UTC4_9AGAM|nr:uracil-DNA glycosylase [Neolentinus lepideus HHB14362 ss-1]